MRKESFDLKINNVPTKETGKAKNKNSNLKLTGTIPTNDIVIIPKETKHRTNQSSTFTASLPFQRKYADEIKANGNKAIQNGKVTMPNNVPLVSNSCNISPIIKKLLI